MSDLVPSASYDDLLDQLAEAERTRMAARSQVHKWYAEQLAAAEQAVARAGQQVAEAEHALVAARGAVEYTDNESTRLWQALAIRMKVPVTALGPPPFAEESEPVTDHPGRLLERARDMLDLAVPARPRHSRRRQLAVALIVLAVLAAAAALPLVLLNR